MTPVRPAYVVVGAITYRIDYSLEAIAHERAEHGDENLLGVCSPRGVIVCDGSLPDDLLRETLLHEILHACYFGVGSPLHYRTPAGADGEEIAVASLSPSLLDVLRSNPAVASFLLS